MKTKILLLVVICALLDLVSISAQADAIYLGAWSTHVKPSAVVTNEKHDLVAIEYGGYMVSSFKNSFDDHTIAVAKRFEIFESGNWKAGVYIGASYGYRGSCQQNEGYDNDPRVVCPLVVPELSYTKHRTQINLSLMGNAVAIGPKWEF